MTALFHNHLMGKEVCFQFRYLKDLRFRSGIGYLYKTFVTDLPAAFRVKRGLCEKEFTLFPGIDCLNDVFSDENPLNSTLVLYVLISGKGA